VFLRAAALLDRGDADRSREQLRSLLASHRPGRSSSGASPPRPAALAGGDVDRRALIS
jgi:hypothetical protein